VALSGNLELAAFAPIYDTDALVRRADSLRKTKAAKPALAQISTQTAGLLGVKSGDKIQLTDSEGGTLRAAVLVNKTIADNTVLVPMGRVDSQSLRTVFGGVTVEAVVASEVQA
jgi:NADH-quinone oxidoreductase subunit G